MIGEVVGNLIATTDSGEDLNHSIESGNESGAFVIDGATGELIVASVLDFYSMASYVLIFRVTDNSILLLDSSATITINIKKKLQTRINTKLAKEGINIYPNPSLGNVKVDIFNASIHILSVTIINTLGEVVYMKPYYSNNIDLSELSSGIYTIVLNSESDVYIKQIVIK